MVNFTEAVVAFDHDRRRKNRVGSGEYFIWGGDELQEKYAYFKAQEGSEKLLSFIENPKFTVKDLDDLSYRIVNHWTSEGLIADHRLDSTQGWRKFSFGDLIWIRVLSELRGFGMSLDKLRETYRTLFERSGTYNPWLFNAALVMSMQIDPDPMFFIVFADGSAEVAALGSLKATDELVGFQHSYVRININTLLCEQLGTDRFLPKPKQRMGRAECYPASFPPLEELLSQAAPKPKQTRKNTSST